MGSLVKGSKRLPTGAFKGQRSLGLSLMLVLAVLAAQTPSLSHGLAQTWQFSVWVDERKLGSHSFEVVGYNRDAGQYEVLSRADLVARFLFIKAFDYQHESNESYVNGCLRTLNSQTRSRGDVYQVRTLPSAQGLRLATRKSDDASRQQDLEGCYMSFAYWDKKILDQQWLINSQTGEVLPVQVTPLAQGAFEGNPAQAYEIESRSSPDGSMLIRVFYAADTGRWIGLESDLENGKVLRYVLESS